MKTRVLIFPAGTEIGLEIWNALKYTKFIKLYGGTSVPCHGEMIFQNYIDDFPFVDDERFIDYLNEVIEKYNIDWIYPAHDSVVMALAENRDRINAKIAVTDYETVDVCRSKNKTYRLFACEDFIPKNYANIEAIDNYPVFVKPAVGQGSNGAELVRSKEALQNKLADGTEYAICEYLPGEEFTVDCFTDKSGRLRIAKHRSRERIRSGIAVRSRLMPHDEEIQSIAERINSRLHFEGAWFFQVKKNTLNKYKLMEISPRIPGTMGVSRNTGINFPLLTLYTMMGYDVELTDNGNSVLLDRAFISRYKTDITYDSVYIDYDDTLYINGKVNTQAMAFLYQAFNAGKKLFLLTKHDGSLGENLRQYRIAENLFDRIVHMERDKEKSDYIVEKNAIFIDDSFAERKKVADTCHIPVFDLDMVESLIDWRK